MPTYGVTDDGRRTATFTATEVWAAPPGLIVEAWVRGGGGGGGTNNLNGGGSGGGGGAFAAAAGITVPAGGTLTVTVGAGGAGAPNVNGQPGGDSWVGSASTVMAKGGAGGVARSGAFSADAGGAGGSAAASVGTTKFAGGNGGAANHAVNGGGGGGGAGTTARGQHGGNAGDNLSEAPAATGGAGGAQGGGAGGNHALNGTAPGGGGGGGVTGNPVGSGARGEVILFYVDAIVNTADATHAAGQAIAATAANTGTGTHALAAALAQTLADGAASAHAARDALAQTLAQLTAGLPAGTWRRVAPGLSGTAYNADATAPEGGVDVLVFRDDTNAVVYSVTTPANGEWAAALDPALTYWISYEKSTAGDPAGARAWRTRKRLAPVESNVETGTAS